MNNSEVWSNENLSTDAKKACGGYPQEKLVSCLPHSLTK